MRVLGDGENDRSPSPRLAGRPAPPRVGTGPSGVAAAGHRGRPGRDRRCGQPVAEPGACRWGGGPAPSTGARRAAETAARPPRPPASLAGLGPGGLRLPGRCMDLPTRGGGDRAALRGPVHGSPCQSLAAPARLASPAAHPSRHPARPAGDRAVVRGALASAQKGALQEGRTIVWVDESGFYLLPGCVRTYAPVFVNAVWPTLMLRYGPPVRTELEL